MQAFILFEQKAPNFAPTFYMLLAGFLLSFLSLLVKLLKHITTFKVAFYRFTIAFFLLGPALFYYKVDPYAGNSRACLKMLLSRGLIGVVALITYMESIKLIPLNEVLLISNLCPIWTISYTVFIQKS